MKFFLDTAIVDDVRPFLNTGFIDGITTNPSLVAASGRDFIKVLEEFAAIIEGPISAEVTAKDAHGMIKEGKKLAQVAPQITVKVPLTLEGLKACYALSQEDIMVNVTLCFSPAQALLAAKAGATFVSPFVGRLDDIGHDGMGLIKNICDIYGNDFDIETEVLAASIRHINHVILAAQAGAHVATVPPKVLMQMLHHPLTDKGLEIFDKDWGKTGQKI